MTEIFWKLEDCNQSKLTIGMFFEFMKLAYQVNNNCENLTTILTSINKIDWSKLAKIDLDCTTQNYNSTDEKYINSDVMQKHKSTNATKEISSETNNTNIKYSVHCIVPSDAKFKNESIDIYNQNLITDFEKCNQVGETSLQVEDAKIIKSVDTTKNLLITLMKTNLSDVLHEGLLDSVLPYMIPKPTISQPIIKKSITNTEVKKSNSLSNNIETRTITNVAHKEKDKKLSKRSIE